MAWTDRPFPACGPSVATEGFLQPPGTMIRRDLGIDQQRSVPRAVQPLAHGHEVTVLAHGGGGAAEAAGDLGDVDRGEPHGVQRVLVRPEMMHLGAVPLVVV